jgi:hypothetical protein
LNEVTKEAIVDSKIGVEKENTLLLGINTITTA